MTESLLLRACDPAFLLAGRIVACGSSRAAYPADAIRADIGAALQRVSSRLSKLKETELFEKDVVRLLAHFLDATVVQSALPASHEFRMGRYSRTLKPPETHPDRAFFEALDLALAPDERRGALPKPALAVFHACLGLGMTGCGEKTAAEIEQYRRQIASQIAHDGVDEDPDVGGQEKLSPDAYEGVDARRLWRRASPFIRLAAVVSTVLLAGVVIGSVIKLQQASEALKTEVKRLSDPDGQGIKYPATSSMSGDRSTNEQALR